MRQVVWMVAAAACSGGGTTDSQTTTDVPTEDTAPEPWTCDPPNYDLASMTCEQLGTAWVNTVKAADHCDVKEDCTVLRAQCEHWNQVDCWYATNASCVDGTVVNEFNAAASDCGGDDVCSCGAMPAADCLNHHCVTL